MISDNKILHDIIANSRYIKTAGIYVLTIDRFALLLKLTVNRRMD